MTKKNILIIDDNTDFSKALKLVCDNSNYEVSLARDTKTAKKRLKESQYCLILLDLCMHGDKIILKDRVFWFSLQRNYPEIPLIAVTGKLLEPDEVWELATQFSFVDLVFKNKIKLPEFRKKIENSINVFSDPNKNYFTEVSEKDIKIATNNINIKELKKWIVDGYTQKVLEVLELSFKNKNIIQNQVIVLLAELKRIKFQVGIGIIPEENAEIRRNRLNFRLLNLIDEIEKQIG